MKRRTFLATTVGLILSSQGATEQGPSPKQIYLTIDDGPGNYMSEILDTLGNQKVVFYIVGDRVTTKEDYQNLHSAIEKGHILGNHSYSHCQFPRINRTQAKQEIEKTDDLIEKVHKETGIPRTHKLFRFPRGKEKHNDILDKLEYTIQSWDIDTRDWQYYSKRKPISLDAIKSNCARAQNKDIVLVHEKLITAKHLIPLFVNSEQFELILPS